MTCRQAAGQAGTAVEKERLAVIQHRRRHHSSLTSVPPPTAVITSESLRLSMIVFTAGNANKGKGRARRCDKLPKANTAPPTRLPPKQGHQALAENSPKAIMQKRPVIGRNWPHKPSSFRSCLRTEAAAASTCVVGSWRHVGVGGGEPAAAAAAGAATTGRACRAGGVCHRGWLLLLLLLMLLLLLLLLLRLLLDMRPAQARRRR